MTLIGLVNAGKDAATCPFDVSSECQRVPRASDFASDAASPETQIFDYAIRLLVWLI